MEYLQLIEKIYVTSEAPQFYYNELSKILYLRSYGGILLWCLYGEEVTNTLAEMHSGAHQSGPKFYDRIRWPGYYWATMVKGVMECSKRRNECQKHVNYIHQVFEPLHPIVLSWPFNAWGMIFIGLINPTSGWGHQYISAATDYFTIAK